MKIDTLVGIGLTAAILGGFAAGGTSFAGGRDGAAVAKTASSDAVKAAKALRKGDAARAVQAAEAAVAAVRGDVGYRMLLAQAYLKAGRFTSANQAFADVLTLSPGDGKAALNLALTQIALGQWDTARGTLGDHAATIPARDRGLALALAGDPVGAVEILLPAARAPNADAVTRQNLALAMALAGRWSEAKSIVEVDVSPAEAQQRILQWVAFAQPTSATDQISALLGVVPVKDAGRPQALALNAPVASATEVAASDPVEAYMPGPSEAAPPVLVVQAVPSPAVVPSASAVRVVEGIRFAERREVVQPLPEPARATVPVRTIAAKGVFKTALTKGVEVAVAETTAKPPAPAKGNWYVQLGAFENAGVARDGWERALMRYAALGDHVPSGMAFSSHGASFYRLSIGGFAREYAGVMCRAYRARGGNCFVRADAGDRIAQWVTATKTEVAAR